MKVSNCNHVQRAFKMDEDHVCDQSVVIIKATLEHQDADKMART